MRNRIPLLAVLAVLALVLTPTLAPAKTAQGDRLGDKELAKRLDAELREAVEQGFSGSVLAVREGKVILDRGYGLADRERGIPNTSKTVFDMGSINKAMTKAAILKLADQGKLSVDDPLSRFFPDAPADKRAITLRQVINHGAGLHEYHDTQGDFEPMTRDQAEKTILGQELRFEPGSKTAYSNSGYSLLAIVIEKVSGESYEDYLRKHILLPADMKRAGFYGEKELWKEDEVATGYGRRTQGARNSPREWPKMSWVLVGAGGLTASTGDLYRYMRAMAEGKILSPDSMRIYYREDGPGADPSTPNVFAGGGDFGFLAVAGEVRGDDTYLLAFSNSARDYSVERAFRPLFRLLRGLEPETGETPERNVERVTVGGEAPPAAGNWGLPGSPTGQAGSAILDMIAAGTKEAIETFVDQRFHPEFRDRFPREQHLQVLGELQSLMKDVELLNAAKTGGSSATLTLRSKTSGEKIEVSYELEGDRIVSMGVGG